MTEVYSGIRLFGSDRVTELFDTWSDVVSGQAVAVVFRIATMQARAVDSPDVAATIYEDVEEVRTKLIDSDNRLRAELRSDLNRDDDLGTTDSAGPTTPTA